MHLQQTKRRSRTSGGPQYYFHDLTRHVKGYLRHVKAVPVALVTPYGATRSSFMAVAADAKLSRTGKVIAGRVGHDRIQQAAAGESIGEAIRYWYKLKSGDFETINVEMEVLDDKFYLTPIGYKYADAPKTHTIQQPEFPLSFNDKKQSELWRRQLAKVRKAQPEMWRWSLEEICRVAKAHIQSAGFRYVKEEDLLRASGPLKVLGVELGPYVGKGFDCPSAVFRFLNYEAYEAPIEIKKASSGFAYQQKRYSPQELSRAVILCVRNDLLNVPANVDIIQLGTLCAALGR
jgi:hypothetical protein